jgi:uncharacterized DUF497 family protein
VPWRFAWDSKKNSKNVAKHAVPFEEAVTVFDDPLAVTTADPNHSLNEFRWATIGRTWRDVLVVVFYAHHGDTIRLISARQPTRQEQRHYEEGI